jgi:hypothetical protein
MVKKMKAQITLRLKPETLQKLKANAAIKQAERPDEVYTLSDYIREVLEQVKQTKQ